MANPKTLGRAAICLSVLLLLGSHSALAATLANENFNYSTGQLTSVSGGNWVANTGSGYLIQVVSGNLSYPSYPASGAGNMIRIISPSGSAEDAYRAFTAQVPGSAMYAGFLLNLANTTGLAADTSTNGDYFVGLLPSSSTTGYVSRVCVRRSAAAGSYQLGIKAAASGATTSWSTADLAPGTTYLVALKYVLVSGASNDSCYLWINPALTASEPAAQLYQVNSSDPGDIARFALRQANNGSVTATPNADIDGLIVGTSWGDIAGFSAPSVLSTAPLNNEAGVPTYASVSVTFDRVMSAATIDTASFALSGRRQARYYPDSIRPATNSASFTFYVRDSLRKADTVTATLGTAIADTNARHLDAPYAWNFHTVLPETIRPYLVSSSPANGEQRVAVSAPVVLTFSEALRPSTVTAASIRLEGRRTAQYQLDPPVLSNGNKTVTLALADTLFYRDTVSVHVTAAVTDLQDNPVRDTSITFQTKLRGGLTIYDIQYTTAPDGKSPYEGQMVTFTGVVTSGSATSGGRSYFVQDGPGPWNGMYVYDGAHAAITGDSVRITGNVKEFLATGAAYTLTEMDPVTMYTVLKQNCAQPAVTVLSTGAATGEAYESVLVEVRNVVVDTTINSYGEWKVNDGSGAVMVDDMAGFNAIRYTPVLGDSLPLVRGILNYNYGAYKIEPRLLGDVINKRMPKVFYSIPANGDINVPSAVAIGVAFTQPMDPATMVPANFTLSERQLGAVPFSVQYDPSTWTGYVIPSRYLSSQETVSVSVSRAITDTSGRPLDGNGNGTIQNDTTDNYYLRFKTIGNILTMAEVQRPGPDGYGSALAGQEVTVQGVVTGPAQYFSSTSWSSSASYYIQDATGGANIFLSGANMSDARVSKLGLLTVATGQVTEYNGVTEIVVDTAHLRTWGMALRLPGIDTMIYDQFLTEDLEGKLVMVDGTISSPPSYAGGGYNTEIRNGDAPIALRFSDVSNFPIPALANGVKVRVIGIVGQYDKTFPYDAGYQMIPRFAAPYAFGGVQYPADITILIDSIGPMAEAKIVSCTPNPLCPDWGEVAQIELNGPITDRLTLRLFDLKGRLVKTLLNNVPGGHQVGYWDGTNDGHRRANIGMYVLHLRSVSTDGSSRDQSMIVVLGTPLK